jgi:hypothetical protein
MSLLFRRILLGTITTIISFIHQNIREIRKGGATVYGSVPFTYGEEAFTFLLE